MLLIFLQSCLQPPFRLRACSPASKCCFVKACYGVTDGTPGEQRENLLASQKESDSLRKRLVLPETDDFPPKGYRRPGLLIFVFSGPGNHESASNAKAWRKPWFDFLCITISLFPMKNQILFMFFPVFFLPYPRWSCGVSGEGSGVAPPPSRLGLRGPLLGRGEEWRGLDKEGKDAADRPWQGWFEAAGLAAQGSFSHHPPLDYVSRTPPRPRRGVAALRSWKAAPTGGFLRKYPWCGSASISAQATAHRNHTLLSAG